MRPGDELEHQRWRDTSPSISSSNSSAYIARYISRHISWRRLGAEACAVEVREALYGRTPPATILHDLCMCMCMIGLGLGKG